MERSQYKIGIFGSAAGYSPHLLETTQQLGRELAKHKVTLITGACSGVPYLVAAAAYQAAGTEIWGFSPSRDFQTQCAATPEDDNSIYSRLIYLPPTGLLPELDELVEDVTVARKYRNVLSTATCDAGIVVAGRYGTLNEFTSLFDIGKVIGVLTGTGGVADELPRLHRAIQKPSQAVVHFEDSPEMLVSLVMTELEKRKGTAA